MDQDSDQIKKVTIRIPGSKKKKKKVIDEDEQSLVNNQINEPDNNNNNTMQNKEEEPDNNNNNTIQNKEEEPDNNNNNTIQNNEDDDHCDEDSSQNNNEMNEEIIIDRIKKFTHKDDETVKSAFNKFVNQRTFKERIDKTLEYLLNLNIKDDENLPTKTIKIPKKRKIRTSQKLDDSPTTEENAQKKEIITAKISAFYEEFPSLSDNKPIIQKPKAWFDPSSTSSKSPAPAPKSSIDKKSVSKPQPPPQKDSSPPKPDKPPAKQDKPAPCNPPKIDWITQKPLDNPSVQEWKPQKSTNPDSLPQNNKKKVSFGKDIVEKPTKPDSKSSKESSSSSKPSRPNKKRVSFGEEKPKSPHKSPYKRPNINTKSHIVKKGQNDTVSFITYIELDMHGKDKRIKKPFDWIPIIRNALFDAHERNVDYVNFITGKGIHSKQSMNPVLRPLVLLTSKRLGFDSEITRDNEGIVTVEISSFKEPVPEEEANSEEEDLTELFRTFGVGAFDKEIDIDEDDSFWDEDDDEDEDDDPYKAVKKRFPMMQDVCVQIICKNRNKHQALKYAENFESRIEDEEFRNSIFMTNNKMTSDEREIVRKRNEQKKKEKEMIKAFRNEYGYDREIIEKVVRDKKNKKKARATFERILSEVPEDFHLYLPEICVDYEAMPIDSILAYSKECKYDYENVKDKLISASVATVNNALNALKMSNKIESTRADGTPKMIPKIEINLKNAGIQKAKITIERVINGIGDGNFSEMILLFSSKKDKCQYNQIKTFLTEKVEFLMDDGCKIKEKYFKNSNRYSMVIINENNEDDGDEDEVNIEEEEVEEIMESPKYEEDSDYYYDE